MRVQVVLYPGVEEIDFIGTTTVLDAMDDMELTYVAVDNASTVTTTSGLDVSTNRHWSPESADLLLVPGGRYGEGSAVDDQIRAGVLPKALAEAVRPGLIMAAVCTGTLLLSAAGITAGRPCTTHWVAKDDLKAQGGNVINARVVDDGNLVTSGGVTSGIDLGLWLVERFVGIEAAMLAESVLEHERRGTVWRAA
jgi:transcriptional regulator GlxA family with amidase domain